MTIILIGLGVLAVVLSWLSLWACCVMARRADDQVDRVVCDAGRGG